MYRFDELYLFPSKVSVSQVENFDWKDDLIKWIEDYKKTDLDNEVHVSNGGGGYQSRINFFNELKDNNFDFFKQKLEDQIQKTIQFYVKDIQLENILKNNHQLKPDSLWINVNPPGGYNHNHVHPGSLLSGVFWVKVPDDSGHLIMHNSMEMNNWCLGPNNFIFGPMEGTMVLFPSYIPHNVTTNKSDDVRISLSFNLNLVSTQ